jgi:hypothetical protein
MAIPSRFICALVASLCLSSAAISQPTNAPPSASGGTVPGRISTEGDQTTKPDTQGRPDGTSVGRAPGALQPSAGGAKERAKEGTDPTTVQEPPSITGNGTAGET